MPKKINIVSGGDSNYFELLKELYLSYKKLNLGNNYVFSILDGGLSDSDKQYFIAEGVKITDPGWPSNIAKLRSRNKNFLKVELAKAHLDSLFPDYDFLVWIDADAWFQNDKALKIMQTIIYKNKLAIFAQASRTNTRDINYKKFFGNLFLIKNILYKHASKGRLDKEIQNSLIARPTLNAGVFALSSGSLHWARLRYWQEKLIRNYRLRIFSITQLALGIIIYHEKLSYEPLPVICNYMGAFRWSNKERVFTHIFAPYEPISIIHMAGQDKMRFDKNDTIQLVNEEDQPINKSLRYNNQ